MLGGYLPTQRGPVVVRVLPRWEISKRQRLRILQLVSCWILLPIIELAYVLQLSCWKLLPGGLVRVLQLPCRQLLSDGLSDVLQLSGR